MKKSEIDKKIKKIDLELDKLIGKRRLLADKRLNCRATYTTSEAKSLMRKGYKMFTSTGLLHQGGYYYSYLYGKFRKHNSGGSIYDNDWSEEHLMSNKLKDYKFWMILKSTDIVNGYLTDSNIIKSKWIRESD